LAVVRRALWRQAIDQKNIATELRVVFLKRYTVWPQCCGGFNHWGSKHAEHAIRLRISGSCDVGSRRTTSHLVLNPPQAETIIVTGSRPARSDVDYHAIVTIDSAIEAVGSTG
jgi:hypothetical protein